MIVQMGRQKKNSIFLELKIETKMEVLTLISCMDAAYEAGKTHPQNILIYFRFR